MDPRDALPHLHSRLVICLARCFDTSNELSLPVTEAKEGRKMAFESVDRVRDCRHHYHHHHHHHIFVHLEVVKRNSYKKQV